MTNSTEFLTETLRTEGTVEIGDGAIVHILKVGNLVRASTVYGICKTVSISDVSSVP